MATWRRKAPDLFPEMHRELGEGDYSIYQLFFDLLPIVQAAHSEKKDDVLRRSYGFVDSCVRQHRSQEPCNAAVVAFLEHLFDDWSLREQVVPWLTEEMVQETSFEWRSRLGFLKWRKLRRLLEQQNLRAPNTV